MDSIKDRELSKVIYQDLIKETILNSRFELLSDTSGYGLIFLGSIENSEKCYFKDANNNIISKYILKGSFISDYPTIIEGNGINEKQSVTLKELNDEIKTQIEIYLKSLKVFNTNIVPDIQLFPESINIDYNVIIQNLKTDTQESIDKKEKLLKYFEISQKYEDVNFNVFIMKYVENYDTYDNILEIINNLEPELEEYKEEETDKEMDERNIRNEKKIEEVNKLQNKSIQKLRYIYIIHHLLLGLLGYIHGDAHGGNIMIYFDKNNIEKSLHEYKAYIIDFGRLNKINIFNFNLNMYKENDINTTNILINTIIYIINSIDNNCDTVRKESSEPKELWSCIDISDYTKLNMEEFSNLLHILIAKLNNFSKLELTNIKLQKYKEIILN